VWSFYVAWAIAEYRGDEVTMYMLKEHPEVLDKHVARAIAEYRSDEVTMYMLKEHPEVLEYEFVAWAIAEYRGDELVKYMIDNYPEVRKQVAYVIAKHRSGELVTRLLKEHPELDKHVAMAIAENRSDELIKYMIDKYPEVLEDEFVARDIAEYRTDKLIKYMIDNYPKVLEYESVARAIAKYRSYELLMYMINKQPEVLKYEYVVKTVIEHGGVEATMNLINEHPEVLKYEYVAMWIVEHRSDKEIIHIIDNLIDRQPNMLGTERLTYNLARTNKLELLTYILLRLGEIKPEDVESTTLQFSVMLRELDDYYKEIVVKQIFLDRKAIDYRKELNSMGPLYLALLDLLNVSKESVERLAKELSKAEGNVRKALPLRGLAYALSHLNDSELNLFIKNSRSVMNDLIMFPTVCELKYAGIISSDEFRQVSDSIDKEGKLYALLAQKVEHAFNVKPKSDDARNAIFDRNFLEDLFGLSIKYHKYNKQAESVLINAITSYFERGIEGFKEFKFGGHELANEQLSDACAIKEKLMNLDKQAVTYTSKRSIPYDSVKNDIDNFLSHKDELLRILDKIKEDAKFKLSEIASSAKSEKLAELLMSKDLDRLTSQAFNPDDERLKAKGIALIKLLKARESLDYINNIVVELQKMAGKSKEEQDLIMEETVKKVAEWVDNGGLEPLRVLRNYISKIKNELGISDKDLYNAKSALDNAKSIIDILLNSSKSVEGAVTAQITFDPSKILTFGRYGSSGSGNCQNSKGDVTYNQSLMSMLGDANQFMIIFYKAGDTKPLGFMQVHLLKSDKGMIFFMERPYTNEPNMTTAMKGAAKMLAQKIKSETGFDCYTYGEVGDKLEKLEVRVPRSYVNRYIDFTRALKGPESFTYEISAKCLTSDPLFGLKRS
ncbi:MAG: hypothetical protein RXR31_06960, partial [Thermoproteota archaeon]